MATAVSRASTAKCAQTRPKTSLCVRHKCVFAREQRVIKQNFSFAIFSSLTKTLYLNILSVDFSPWIISVDTIGGYGFAYSMDTRMNK